MDDNRRECLCLFNCLFFKDMGFVQSAIKVPRCLIEYKKSYGYSAFFLWGL